MLTFVVTHEGQRRELRQIVTSLRAKGHNIAAAHLNVNAERTNVIFGPTTIALSAVLGLRERLCDLDFEIGPTGFFQINPEQAEQIYRRVEQLAGTARPGMKAWDLYSGVGQMSLILARQGYKTVGVEENPEAVAQAKVNAERNRIPGVEFLEGRVEDCLRRVPDWAQNPDLIVANPARTGMADHLRPFLAETLAKGRDTKLIYVSCEVKTLARDLADLLARGRSLIQIQPFDMFPFTDKLEWLAVVG
jgi:23S rRNA (uracil1939-C5)-methyltransferase